MSYSLNDYWKPQHKYQVVDWLFSYYKGKYSKPQIRKSNVWGWYHKIRKGLA